MASASHYNLRQNSSQIKKPDDIQLDFQDQKQPQIDNVNSNTRQSLCINIRRICGCNEKVESPATAIKILVLGN